jgi:hypothetical protein
LGLGVHNRRRRLERVWYGPKLESRRRWRGKIGGFELTRRSRKVGFAGRIGPSSAGSSWGETRASLKIAPESEIDGALGSYKPRRSGKCFLSEMIVRLIVVAVILSCRRVTRHRQIQEISLEAVT